MVFVYSAPYCGPHINDISSLLSVHDSISNLKQMTPRVFPLDVTELLNSLETVAEECYQYVKHCDLSYDDVKKE